MHSYPRNSPEAAARIVALVLIADGHVCRSEVDTLGHLRIEESLGLPAGGFDAVVHTLCEDLLLDAYAAGAVTGRIDPPMLAAFFAEVDDPALRQTVLRLAHAAADADRHRADAETIVLDAAQRHWRLAAPAEAEPV